MKVKKKQRFAVMLGVFTYLLLGIIVLYIDYQLALTLPLFVAALVTGYVAQKNGFKLGFLTGVLSTVGLYTVLMFGFFIISWLSWVIFLIQQGYAEISDIHQAFLGVSIFEKIPDLVRGWFYVILPATILSPIAAVGGFIGEYIYKKKK